MKAESLFHLLQIRARKLEEDADVATKQKLKAIQGALRVTHTRGWFEITWQFDGRDYNLSVPERDFTFYVAGDTPKAIEQRGNTGNLRDINWQSASALWQRLSEISGFVLASTEPAKAMGLTPASGRPRASRRHQGLAGLAVVLAGIVVTLLQAGVTAALLSGLVAVLLLLLVPGLEETHLRRRFSPFEVAFVGAPAFVPAWTGDDIVWLLPVLAGLNCVLWLEQREMRLVGGWLLGGFGIGASSFALGWAALLPAAVSALALAVLHLLASRRIARAESTCYGAGVGIGLVTGTMITSTATTGGGASWIAGCLAGLLLTCFVLWPFHGLLFRLVPWLTIGTLGLASLAATLAGPAVGEGAMALAGLALVATVRLTTAILAAMASGLTRPEE